MVAEAQGKSYWSERGSCSSGVEPAHIVSRGAGGGRFDIVPLCSAHHAEQHAVGIDTFARLHSLDLRAEADRVALGHASPLGIRGLAERWAFWQGDVDRADPHSLFPRLSTYEHDALMGWVRRRMDEQKEHAAWTTVELAGDSVTVYSRRALAYVVGLHLGGDFECGPEDSPGLAWTLCEAAGWPS